MAQHLTTTPEQCIVAMILVIPRIPHDPNSDVQELLRARLTETLSSHYKITIIDQYDGDDETSAQRQRAWEADEPSYYGHPSSPSQPPKFTEAAQLDMCSAFCFRARRLTLAYETERIAAIGQGSYLYQNDTGLPSDTGYDDSVKPLRELSICDKMPLKSMHAGATEQRTLMCASHDLLEHMQKHFRLAGYGAKGETHIAVFEMLVSKTEFFTTSYENTDEGLLHALSTRVVDLHLVRHEPTSVNLNSLAQQHGDNNVAKHIVRQAATYFQTARTKPLSYSTQIAACSTHEYSASLFSAQAKVDARLESEHTSENVNFALHESYSHDQKCRSMRSLDEINQHLERGVMNVSLLPKRDTVPDKYRDKHKHFAIKKQTDSEAGITRWDPPSGDRRDLQWSAAFLGLPMVPIHITPTRTEPYEIDFFDKYQTMTDPTSSASVYFSLGNVPPTPPAVRLRRYIRTKLAENCLVILQIHTGPQQYHFGTITKLVTPAPAGYHDYYIPVTSLGPSSSSSEVVKDILSARGIPFTPDQPAPPAAPQAASAAPNPPAAASGPSSERPDVHLTLTPTERPP